jgi:hypothetical protein
VADGCNSRGRSDARARVRPTTRHWSPRVGQRRQERRLIASRPLRHAIRPDALGDLDCTRPDPGRVPSSQHRLCRRDDGTGSAWHDSIGRLTVLWCRDSRRTRLSSASRKPNPLRRLVSFTGLTASMAVDRPCCHRLGIDYRHDRPHRHPRSRPGSPLPASFRSSVRREPGQ